MATLSRLRRIAFVVPMLVVAVACSSSSSSDPQNGGGGTTPPTPPGAHPVASGSVGPSGGTVESNGVKLVVPPGALSSDTVISISTVDGPAPPDHDVLSPIYEFGPEGLTFAQPATIEMTITGLDGNDVKVLWTVPGGQTYEELATTAVSAGRYSAPVSHFSHGLLGRKHQVEDSGPPTDSSPPTDASPDGHDEAGVCAPYAGACSPATTGPRCCNNVPCVQIIDDAGTHYMCLFTA
jgi:hypothetical protein